MILFPILPLGIQGRLSSALNVIKCHPTGLTSGSTINSVASFLFSPGAACGVSGLRFVGRDVLFRVSINFVHTPFLLTGFPSLR